jgi:membrane fusion protein
MQRRLEKLTGPHAGTEVERTDDVSSLFRAEAVNASQQRWLGPVLIVTPPSLRLTVVVALLSIILLLGATIVIEIPERVRASGVLLPGNGMLHVRASRAGWVDKLDVANGRTVRSGQSLMWLTDAEHAPQHAPEAIERLLSLRTELQLLEQSLRQEIAAAAEHEILSAHRKQLMQSRITIAEQEYQVRLQQSELQQRQSTRIRSLVTDAVIPAHIGDEQASLSLDALAARDMAEQRVLEMQDQLALLDLQSHQDIATLSRLQTQTEIRRESLLRDIAASELRSNLEVASPDNGIVAGLAVRTGSFVQAGQLLLTLYDPADTLEAFLYVSADNAGMIKLGQSVELQLRAYPHQLFGTQTATITDISAAAIPIREIEIGVSFSGPVFEIRAALASANVIARGDNWRLPPGTLFDANLIRRRWPLYRWLLRSITDEESSRV